MVIPARPGAHARVGHEPQLHVLTALARVALARSVGGYERAGPAEAGGEPGEEQHARDRRVGPVADRHGVDARELGAPSAVEGRGHPLAPRRGAQPGQVDHGGARRARGARLTDEARSGSLIESTSTTWARGRSASTASSCPWGDQSTVARSETTSGSTIVSSSGRCPGPRRARSARGRGRPQARIAPDGERGGPGVDRGAAGLDRAQDRARGCSGPRSRGGSGSPRHSRSATTTRFSTRAGA